MNYSASISAFFQPPKWMNNMLLGAVAMLIPAVGPIVLSGWHTTILWNPSKPGEPKDYEPFDFQHFSKYLQRGVWPFLVNLVASFALVPVMFCFMLPVFLVMGASGHHSDDLAFLVFPFFILMQMVVMLVWQFIATPLTLRATLTQGFKEAFHLSFIRDFIARMWMDMLVTALFMFVLGICLVILTIITCYIGMFFASPVIMFAWHHLQKQLYQKYLSLGGMEIPASPTLMDGPPPLPL